MNFSSCPPHLTYQISQLFQTSGSSNLSFFYRNCAINWTYFLGVFGWKAPFQWLAPSIYLFYVSNPVWHGCFNRISFDQLWSLIWTPAHCWSAWWPLHLAKIWYTQTEFLGHPHRFWGHCLRSRSIWRASSAPLAAYRSTQFASWIGFKKPCCCYMRFPFLGSGRHWQGTCRKRPPRGCWRCILAGPRTAGRDSLSISSTHFL